MTRLSSLLPATAAVAVVIGVALSLAVSTATPAGAADLCVSTYASIPYHSIQAAINAAEDGDTIKVAQGTWYETLVITEDITLQGGWSLKCTTRLSEDPQFTAVDGGAAGSVVSITAGSTATLDGLTVTNGQSQKGGGVYVSDASPTLQNVVVTQNVVAPVGSDPEDWAYGGGVFVENGTITLMECDITHNMSYPAASDLSFGGGVALYGSYASEGRAVLQGTHILSNTNPSDSHLLGGGLFLYPFSQVTFEGTENLIAYNESYGGGGVYMYGNVDLEGALILKNHASYSGGGIYIASGWSGARIANNYLEGNTAAVDAPSVFAMDVSVGVANNTIVGDFYGSGAGVYVHSAGNGTLELTNNILVNHSVGIEKDTGASATLANNDVWGNTTNYVGVSAGSGDISQDPDFVDPDNGNYHLGASSPCINAGEYIAGLFFDYDGERRTGTLLDMGADEYGSDYLSFVPAAYMAYAP